jgi:hypothetical protein
MSDQSVIGRDPIPINLWQAISEIMSRNIFRSSLGLRLPLRTDIAFLSSDEDESLILSTDGKKNISTISDNKK